MGPNLPPASSRLRVRISRTRGLPRFSAASPGAPPGDTRCSAARPRRSNPPLADVTRPPGAAVAAPSPRPPDRCAAPPPPTTTTSGPPGTAGAAAAAAALRRGGGSRVRAAGEGRVREAFVSVTGSRPSCRRRAGGARWLCGRPGHAVPGLREAAACARCRRMPQAVAAAFGAPVPVRAGAWKRRNWKEGAAVLALLCRGQPSCMVALLSGGRIVKRVQGKGLAYFPPPRAWFSS
ncbi:cell division protein DipM-like [Lathamus discolor]|uniref:cell division protein DipM-like n=1 Tax=Lathamus discolor TaxID=678569 RepID=UPI0032B82E03